MSRMLGLAALLPLAVGCHDDDDDGLTLFVDAVFGNDSSGDGSPEFPYRTISHAIEHSARGDLIRVAPGTYSTTIGETFPIRIPENVTVEGDAGTRGQGTTATLITGGGTQTTSGGTNVNVAVVIDGGGVLRGLTVTNPGGVGVLVDNDTVTIEFNTVTGNGGDGLRHYVAGTSTIQNNTITSNTGNGIVTFDAAAPVIRQNNISSNTVDGVQANGSSNPNLENGGNTLQGNGGVGLFNNTGSVTIKATANTWRVSVQGSNASGQYSAFLDTGPETYVAATNYAIAGAGAIQF